MRVPLPLPSSRSDWIASMRDVMIRGRTTQRPSVWLTQKVLFLRRSLYSPVALNALSQVVPGISRISGQALGMVSTSTVLETARPIAIAITAAMTIWAADPGSLIGCHQAFSGSTIGVAGTSWTSTERDESVRQVSRVSPVSFSLPISRMEGCGVEMTGSNEINREEASEGEGGRLIYELVTSSGFCLI